MFNQVPQHRYHGKRTTKRINPKRSKLPLVLLTLSLLTLALSAWFLLSEVTHEKITSPDGQYVATVSYHRYRQFMISMPGGGSDKPGYIRIHDQQGNYYGKVPIPMLWISHELNWEADGANLKLAGEWDFSKKEYRYWSDNGNEQHIFTVK